MRRLAVALVVLLVVLFAADRAGAAYTASAVADEVERAAALDTRPEVEITGFPFLTQAVSGRYDRIEVRATDVTAADGLLVSALEATLRGVTVPLSDALSQSVQDVPVDGVTARAVVSYEELSRRYGGEGVRVEPDGDGLRITGELTVAGRTLSAVARSRVEVDDGDLLLSTEEVGLQDGDGESSSALREALELRVPVQDLPYGLTVTSAEVRPDGVALRAEAADVVLQSP